MKVIMTILATVFVGCSLVALTNGYAKQKADPSRATSAAMDKLFAYFRYMGKVLKIDESKQEALFAPDFKMIINGMLVVDGRDKLAPHFEHLFGQVSGLEMTLHEKVVAGEKCVMRYDVLKPGKSTTRVMALFKFRDGQAYEMNEVVHSDNPGNEIDFMTR